MVLDQRFTLSDYEGHLRQLSAKDLGHDGPTVLLTIQIFAASANYFGMRSQKKRSFFVNGVVRPCSGQEVIAHGDTETHGDKGRRHSHHSWRALNSSLCLGASVRKEEDQTSSRLL